MESKYGKTGLYGNSTVDSWPRPPCAGRASDRVDCPLSDWHLLRRHIARHLGVEWARHPTIGPALVVGIGSVAHPQKKSYGEDGQKSDHERE